MIRTKGGGEVKILSGSKKCITGKKPFVVQVVSGQKNWVPSKTLKLTKAQLVYDSEDELYQAIGL